jgi:hypothetical protein
MKTGFDDLVQDSTGMTIAHSIGLYHGERSVIHSSKFKAQK